LSTDARDPRINPKAGQQAAKEQLADIQKLLEAYSILRPDTAVPAERVVFGTSGHRGSSFSRSFNEAHVLAISQAICHYRQRTAIDGPMFIGFDTHALSLPAFESALEVLAANSVDVLVSEGGEYTPTPAVSHAILAYNKGRTSGLADGIVITPSHNPPEDGGFKYNPSHGGPADSNATGWIEKEANRLMAEGLTDVRRMPYARAKLAETVHAHDFLGAYTADLGSVLDFDVIRASGLRLGVDPLGGAGVHYWGRIAERYDINLSVVSEQVDPTFPFMTLDWDGRIRMDPSSPYAMRRLTSLKDKYDVAFACDTDHDRHGIVVPRGLMLPNHYLASAIDYLYRNRPQWRSDAAVGKTIVSSTMIDRVVARLGRRLYEVPVGFKYFVDGLLEGSLGFGGEESAGASFLRRDASVWSTDKDGIAAALLSAEMTARGNRTPDLLYADLEREFGVVIADRIDAPATLEQKRKLASLSPEQVQSAELAGESIERVLSHAPGTNSAIGGIKVVTKSGWFAARPSGTENIYKIYAESFRDEEHLRDILHEAQAIVDSTLA